MILVVDDHPHICRAMELLFQSSGVDALCVTSPREALRLLDEKQPDAVLLDHHMPDLTGMDVLKMIRSNPKTQAIPVVMFSADADPQWVDESRRLGAQGYFVKGRIELNDLIERVRALAKSNHALDA
jgi:CheY-like chemotaxis protein